VKVADKMNDEAERHLPVGEARLRVLEDASEAREGFERVAFGGRTVIDDPVEVHEMPRHRRFLPVIARSRAHLIGPVGGFIETFAGTENLLDLGAGEAAQLRVGNRGDDPMPRLAPGGGG
jgi:hypothetical protein